MASAPQPARHRDRSPLRLVSGKAPRRGSYSPLELWHLLSLDAPAVATLWTGFIAWCAGVRLAGADLPAMFVAVWMLYAADRLLDARPLATGTLVGGLEERHRFHYRHRRRFVPCLVVAALPLALLVSQLPAAELGLYATLAALLAGWLLLVHVQPEPSAATRLPKEIATGLFFPAAVFIPTVARTPALRLALLPAALLFAFACVLNCLFLYAWEHPQDRSRAHPTTRWSLRFLVPLALALTLLSTLAALLALRFPNLLRAGEPRTLIHPVALPAACALSGCGLLLLHGARHRLPALRLRALADAALLSPVVLWIFITWGPSR